MFEKNDGFEPYVCQRCGYPFFDQKFLIDRKSMIISAKGNEELRVKPTLVCEACSWIVGTPIGDISQLPKEMQELRKKVFKKLESQNDVCAKSPVEIQEPETIEKGNITNFVKK